MNSKQLDEILSICSPMEPTGLFTLHINPQCIFSNYDNEYYIEYILENPIQHSNSMDYETCRKALEIVKSIPKSSVEFRPSELVFVYQCTKIKLKIQKAPDTPIIPPDEILDIPFVFVDKNQLLIILEFIGNDTAYTMSLRDKFQLLIRSNGFDATIQLPVFDWYPQSKIRLTNANIMIKLLHNIKDSVVEMQIHKDLPLQLRTENMRFYSGHGVSR